MKIILSILLILTFGLKEDVYAIGINNNVKNIEIAKLRKFNQNIDSMIFKDLQSLNGYLKNKLLKEIQNKLDDTKICIQEHKSTLKSGNIGTRIYTTQCYKKYRDDLYTIFNKRNINAIFNEINELLTQKHNHYIKTKASILKINYRNYTKNIYYNIDNIDSVSINYVNTLSQLNTLWYEVLKNMKIYDESFGYMDNAKFILELAIGNGETARDQAIIEKNTALNNIYNEIRTFADKSTINIKNRFKEDVFNTLNNMYMEDGY